MSALMKISIFWVVVLFTSLRPLAQNLLLPVKQDGKWGLIDETGVLVLTAQFDRMSDFDKNGFAYVKNGFGTGLLNNKGQLVVEVKAEFENIQFLSNELLAIQSKGQWGVVDSEGKELIPYEFLSIRYDSAQSLLITENLNKYGQGLYGAYTLDGQKICNPRYYDEFKRLNDTLIQVRYVGLGLLKTNGEIVLDPVCNGIKLFRNAYFFNNRGVWNYKFDDSDSLYGDWDEFVVERDYLFVRVGELWGIYDFNKHKYIIEPSLSKIESFDGIGMLSSKDGQFGVLSYEGKVIVPTTYDRILSIGSGLIAVQKNGLTGIYTISGRKLIDAECERVNFLKDEKDVLTEDPYFLKYKVGENWGVIDVKASKKWLSPLYKQVYFENGKLRAIQEGKADVFVIENGKVVDQFSFKNFEVLKVDFDSGDIWGGDPSFVSGGFVLQAAPSEPWKTMVVDGLTPYYKVDTGWGLQAVENGKRITDALFDEIKMFYFQKYPFAIGIKKLNMGNCRYYLIFKDGKIVYNASVEIDKKTTATKPITYISEFTEDGLAAINLGGKRTGKDSTEFWAERGYWGFIDTLGNFVISPKYKVVSQTFHGQRAVVSKNERQFGVIDTKDKTIIPFEFSKIEAIQGTDFSLYQTTILQDVYGFVSDRGKVLTDVEYTKVKPFKNNVATVQSGKYYAFVDTTGRFFADYSIQRTSGFTEGLAAVRLNNKWGYINFEGDTVIAPQFDNAGPFSNGLATVKVDKLYGYINPQGEFVIAPRYKKAYDFIGDFAVVKGNVKNSFLINQKGHKIHRKIERLDNKAPYGLIKAKTKRGYVYLNEQGHFASKVYSKLGHFHNGYARASIGYRKMGYIDSTGHEVKDVEFTITQDFHEGIALVRNNGKWQFIDTTFKAIANQGSGYWRAGNMSEGFAYVNKAKIDSVGFLTSTGRFVKVDAVSSIGDVKDGYARAIEKNYSDKRKLQFYVNPSGKLVFGQKFRTCSDFQNGVAIVQGVDGRWGVIDYTGSDVFPRHYKKIVGFDEGIAIVYLDRLLGVYNGEGKELLAPDYESISGVSASLLKVYKGGRIGYLNKDGEWLWSPRK